VLAYLDAPTLGQPETFVHAKDGTFGADGGIADERTRGFVQKWLDRYAAWVAQHAR
jgi:chromate reductase